MVDNMREPAPKGFIGPQYLADFLLGKMGVIKEGIIYLAILPMRHEIGEQRIRA